MYISFQIIDTIISPHFLIQLLHYNHFVPTPIFYVIASSEDPCFLSAIIFHSDVSRAFAWSSNACESIVKDLCVIGRYIRVRSIQIKFVVVHKIQWKFTHKILDFGENSLLSGKPGSNWLQIYIRNICVEIKRLGQARQGFYTQFHKHKLRQLLAKTPSKFRHGWIITSPQKSTDFITNPCRTNADICWKNGALDQRNWWRIVYVH